MREIRPDNSKTITLQDKSEKNPNFVRVQIVADGSKWWTSPGSKAFSRKASKLRA